jgi:hypothetical protein
MKKLNILSFKNAINKHNSVIIFFTAILFLLISFAIGKNYQAQRTQGVVEKIQQQPNASEKDVESVAVNRLEILKALDNEALSYSSEKNWVQFSSRCKAINRYLSAIYYPKTWVAKEEGRVSSGSGRETDEEYECLIIFGYPRAGETQYHPEGLISEIRIAAYYLDDDLISIKDHVVQKYEEEKALFDEQLGMDYEHEVLPFRIGDGLDAVKVLSSRIQRKNWHDNNLLNFNHNYQVFIKDGHQVFDVSLTSFGLHSYNISVFKELIGRLQFK